MFNLLGTENELNRMRKAHNLKLEKLKLQGEMYIEENKIKNEISLNKLKAEKNQLKVNNEIRELKTEVKQDKSIIKAGTFLNFWGTLGTIVSTLLTIAGLWSFFNGSYLKAVSFILAIVMTQFTVYILAKQDTNIKKYFAQHAFKVSVLKFVLLSISIYGNYTFFTNERTINFIDCPALQVFRNMDVNIVGGALLTAAQELLDGLGFFAGLQKPGGKSVPQRMGVYVLQAQFLPESSKAAVKVVGPDVPAGFGAEYRSIRPEELFFFHLLSVPAQ